MNFLSCVVGFSGNVKIFEKSADESNKSYSQGGARLLTRCLRTATIFIFGSPRTLAPPNNARTDGFWPRTT
jgi:hypothetical protein